MQSRAMSDTLDFNSKLKYGKFKGKRVSELIENAEFDYLFWLRSVKTNKETGEKYKTKMTDSLNAMLDVVLYESDAFFVKWKDTALFSNAQEAMFYFHEHCEHEQFFTDEQPESHEKPESVDDIVDEILSDDSDDW